MDSITGFPVSKKTIVILVVVDRLSKADHLGTLPTSFIAITLANLFIEIVIKLLDFPLSIVYDRDPIFLNKFWKVLFQLSSTTLKNSTAYHPQTDDQTKVINRCLEQYLRAFTYQHPKNWTKFLILGRFMIQYFFSFFHWYNSI